MENTNDVHSVLTKYYKEFEDEHDWKFVRVTFNDVGSSVEIMFDTDRPRHVIYSIYDGDFQLTMITAKPIYKSKSMWRSLKLLVGTGGSVLPTTATWGTRAPGTSPNTLDKSAIAEKFLKGDGDVPHLEMYANRVATISNILYNTNIASVEVMEV